MAVKHSLNEITELHEIYSIFIFNFYSQKRNYRQHINFAAFPSNSRRNKQKRKRTRYLKKLL